MDRMERREVLLAGVAIAGSAVLAQAEPPKPPEIPGWIKNYDPRALVEIALDDFDDVLQHARWVPPRKVTDTTIVPHFLDTSKMVRDYQQGTFEDNEVIEVSGTKYKLDWIMSYFELSGPIETDMLRTEYVTPSLNFWRKQFCDQKGEALIVTRLPTRDVQARRSLLDVRSFTMVKHRLAMRATVMTNAKADRAFLVFDSLVGLKT